MFQAVHTSLWENYSPKCVPSAFWLWWNSSAKKSLTDANWFYNINWVVTKWKTLWFWLIYFWFVSTSLNPSDTNPTTLSPQNFLRCQNNKNNYNLVCETLQFLDCICGSTTGGLGLLGLYINEKNVALINQTLESLTEYCQGPCHENQVGKDTVPGGGVWMRASSHLFFMIF